MLALETWTGSTKKQEKELEHLWLGHCFYKYIVRTHNTLVQTLPKICQESIALNSVTEKNFLMRKWEMLAFHPGFPGASVVKDLPANAGEAGDLGSIPGWGRSPGGGNGNPLQYSCLGNPMDRGARWATVHKVTKSWTWLSNWAHTHTHTHTHSTSLRVWKNWSY